MAEKAIKLTEDNIQTLVIKYNITDPEEVDEIIHDVKDLKKKMYLVSGFGVEDNYEIVDEENLNLNFEIPGNLLENDFFEVWRN